MCFLQLFTNRHIKMAKEGGQIMQIGFLGGGFLPLGGRSFGGWLGDCRLPKGAGRSQLLIWFWQHAAAGRNNEVPADQ